MKNKIFLALAAVMLGLPVLLQGLFLETQQYVFCFISFIAILAVLSIMTMEKEPLHFQSALDFALPIFALVFLVSVLFAVSKKIAVVEVLNYINYLFVFILVRYLSKEEKNIKALLQIFFWSTVMVAAIGIGGATNLIPYEGAYSQANNWINGPMQNHNVFGVICLVGIMLGYGLYMVTEENWKRLIYAIGGFLLIMGAMNAAALSAWVVFPIILFAFIILTWRNWTKIAAYSIILVVPYLCFAKKFGTAMAERDFWGMLCGVLFGLLVTVALVFIAEYFRKMTSDVRNRMGYISIAVVILAIASISIFSMKLLPEKTTEQFTVKALTEMASERGDFYHDSYTFIKTKPIIGGGGNAWSAVYPTYQSSSDVSQQEQSYMMQIWIEAGIIGLVLFLGFIVVFFYSAYLVIKKHHILGIIAVCSAFLLLAHSFLDSDFTLSSVGMLFWALIAVIAAMSYQEKWVLKISPYYFIGIAALGLIVTSMFYIGLKYSIAGGEAVTRQDYTGATTVFGKAIKWNPLDDESRLSYIYTKLFMLSKGGEQEPEFVDQFNNTLQSVLARSQENVQIVAAGQVLYDYTSQNLESIAMAERLAEIRPLSAESYETLVRAYVNRSNELLKKGDKEGAKTFLNYIIDVPNVMDQLTALKKEKVTPTANTIVTIQKAKDAIKEIQ